MNINFLYKIIIAVVVFTTFGAAQNRTYVLWGATLIDVTHSNPVHNGAVVVEGRKFGDIGKMGQIYFPPQAETIDCRGKYIMPGLIDVHTHYEKPEDLVRMLAWGVTSVNMMFESTDEALKMERWTATDTARSPRVYATAPIFTTKNGWWWGDEFPNDTSINRFPATPVEAREQMRKVKNKGIHRIKLMYDDMSWCRDPLKPMKQMDSLVMRALIDEAKKLGLYVEVHAPNIADAKRAVDAGANALMHGVIDQRIGGDLLVTIQSNQIQYVSTFCLYNFLADVKGFMNNALSDSMFRQSLPEGVIKEYSSEAYYKRYKERYPNFTFVSQNLPILNDNLTNLIANQISEPLGTDMWAFPGIAAHLELEYMKKAGISTRDIFINSTACSAEFLGIRKTVGYMLQGYEADLVVLDKDPYVDIRNTRSISMVIKRGKIFKPQDLLNSIK